MKILAIVGSSKFGTSSEVIKFFEKQITSYGDVEFETLYLSDYPIDFCKGCHNCIFIGEDKCPQYEKVKVIEDKMLQSDDVTLSSNEKELDKLRENIKKDSKKFYDSISKKGRIKIDMGQIVVFHVFRTLAKIFPNIFKADYAYFTKIDGYNKNFYIDAKVPFIKNLFGNFIELITKKDFEKKE